MSEENKTTEEKPELTDAEKRRLILLAKQRKIKHGKIKVAVKDR